MDASPEPESPAAPQRAAELGQAAGPAETVASADTAAMQRMPRASFRAGLRAGVPFGIASFVLSLSFGVLARQVGFSAVGAIAMSAIVFAGSAQFAAITILGGGGGIAAATAAAALMNSRFLPMGVALAPSLPGRWLRRALQGQTVVDSSWAMSNRGDGSFDRHFLFGTTVPQYVCWLGGTTLGALGGSFLGDIDRLGLDAVYPAFFLSLLFAEMRDRRTRVVALSGGAIALALVPFAPAGVPVLAASLAALIGLRRRAPAKASS
jgi:4-azaleucine resistance transporter AzlC